ncbi:MAG: hypothetical protein U0744_01185 [Gemmataceae bacterium]
MMRYAGAILGCALVLAFVGAQDVEPRLKKKDKAAVVLPLPEKVDPKDDKNDEPMKKAVVEPKDEGKEADAKKQVKKDSPPEEDPQAIIERLKKNLEEADTKLSQPDPGEQTAKLQQDIIDDLEKLINQKQNNQGGGGGQQGGGQQGGGQAGGGGGQGGGQQGGGQSGKGGQGGNGGGQANGGGQGGKGNGQGKNGGDGGAGGNQQANAGGGGGNQKKQSNGAGGQGKDEKKDGKDGGGGGGNADLKKTDPGQGGGGLAKDTPNRKADPLAGEYKDAWGNLPLKKREEMDAFARERLMPRYEEILRQYYRTIAEQGRKKDIE